MRAIQKTWKLRDGSVLVIGRKANYYYPDGENGRRIVVNDSQARLMVDYARFDPTPPLSGSSAHDVEVDYAAETVRRFRGGTKPR